MLACLTERLEIALDEMLDLLFLCSQACSRGIGMIGGWHNRKKLNHSILQHRVSNIHKGGTQDSNERGQCHEMFLFLFELLDHLGMELGHRKYGNSFNERKPSQDSDNHRKIFDPHVMERDK